jgi:hypothetical protein
MNKFVKLLITALVAVIGLSFTACGDGSGDNGGGNGNGTGTAPTVTTATLSGGTVGTAYSQTLTATGDTPITWSLATGSLPGGLTLSTAGVISGNPTTANTFNFTVKATNATGNNTKPLSITIASGDGGNAGTYIITGSGTTFTATKNGATIGTANQALYIIINAIQTNANGADLTIQFGNGTNVLDIGTSSVEFTGTWGIITLTGKITSSGNNNTIRNSTNASINSTADIENTNTENGSRAISNGTGGTVNITGGTITGRTAIINSNATGTVIINSGTVTGIGGDGISNRGTVTISGGSVSMTGGSGGEYAIYNNNGGTVNITGGTVTSNGNVIENTNSTLNISNNAKVEGTNSSISVIRNSSNGTVIITGGTISATGMSSYAVQNLSGTVTVTTPPTVIDKTKTSGTITWLP